MANTPDFQDLYRRAIALNQDAFQAGSFDAAYHALESALYLAEKLQHNEPIQQVIKIAAEQLAWIDKHAPE